MRSRTVPVNESVTTSSLGNCVLTIYGFPFLIVLTATELDFSACSAICGEEKAEILEMGSFPSLAVTSSPCCDQQDLLEVPHKHHSLL